MPLKNIGFNFLENHPEKEKEMNLDPNHVIVDRIDWEIVIDYFKENPHVLEKIGKKGVPWFG